MANELTGRRRGKPAGEELRRRVVAAVLEKGMSRNAAAQHFEVSDTSVARWIRRYRQHGHLREAPRPGRPSRIEPERERIFAVLERRPDLSIRALQGALAARGLVLGTGSLQRFLVRHGVGRGRRPARHRKRAPKAAGRS